MNIEDYQQLKNYFLPNLKLMNNKLIQMNNQINNRLNKIDFSKYLNLFLIKMNNF